MTNPRPLTPKQLNLVEFYSTCQLGMTPQRFRSKWSLTHEQIALICARSVSHVRFWFSSGRHYRRPTPNDLRHLAIMDFLLEHNQDIPPLLLNILCPPHRDS
jgi:hypothetical protein